MFPLVFHFIILILDYTLDKIDYSKIEDKLDVYKSILKKQTDLKQQINEYKRNKMGDMEAFKGIQNNLLEMFRKEGNEFIPKFQKEAEEE